MDLPRNFIKQPTAADYRRERELRGTQTEIAKVLGVHRITIVKRERGAEDAPITKEAWLALLSLPRKTPPLKKK